MPISVHHVNLRQLRATCALLTSALWETVRIVRIVLKVREGTVDLTG